MIRLVCCHYLLYEDALDRTPCGLRGFHQNYIRRRYPEVALGGCSENSWWNADETQFYGRPLSQSGWSNDYVSQSPWWFNRPLYPEVCLCKYMGRIGLTVLFLCCLRQVEKTELHGERLLSVYSPESLKCPSVMLYTASHPGVFHCQWSVTLINILSSGTWTSLSSPWEEMPTAAYAALAELSNQSSATGNLLTQRSCLQFRRECTRQVTQS